MYRDRTDGQRKGQTVKSAEDEDAEGDGELLTAGADEATTGWHTSLSPHPMPAGWVVI